jgi:VCBS repeat-containing protein
VRGDGSQAITVQGVGTITNDDLPNSPPVATDDSYSTDEDTTLTVPDPGVLANDSDVDVGDTLDVVLDTQVSHGQLNLEIPGNFVYTPDPDFNGQDTFTYHVSDGQSDSAIVTVTISVNPVNDPPVATDDTATTNQDIPIEILSLNLVSNDSDGGDGGALVITGVQNSQNGNAVFDGINNKVIFTPAAGVSGISSFEYVVSDGTDTDVGLVTINVISTAELFCGLPESAYHIIDGTPGNDNLKGTNGNDLIRGFGGDDKLKGKNGNDCLIGGDGKDKLWGAKGNDTLEGNNNDDKLYGGEGNDSISGGEGKDRMWGGKGIDTLNGDSGDDRIHGGQGNDNIDGGANIDRCHGGSGTNSIVNCENMTSMTEEDEHDDEEDDE